MEYGTHTHTRTHTQRERGASCTGWAVGGSYWPCDRRRVGWGHLVTGWGMRRFSGKVGWRDHGVSWKGRHGVSGTHWTCTKAIKLHLACRKEHPVGQHPPALGPAYGKILIDPITCVDVWVEGVATAELRVTDATLIDLDRHILSPETGTPVRFKSVRMSICSRTKGTSHRSC